MKGKNRKTEKFIKSLIHKEFFDALGYAISIQDTDFKILFQNSHHRDIIGDKVGEYCYKAVHGRSHVCSRCHLVQVFKDGKTHTFEQSRITDDDTKYYEITGSALKDKKGNIIAGIETVRDITRRKKMEKKLRETSITDELTGLFNRRGFFTFAEQQCRLANRSSRRMSLLYVDLDGMKTINDELGHNEGDRALIDTATILKKTFRSSDIIARIGGDEFAVLLTEAQEPDMKAIIIDHVQNNLNIFNAQGEHKYELLLSMGLADYDPHNPCSLDDLLMRADDLMYLDKRHHKHELEEMPSRKEERQENRRFTRYAACRNCSAELDGISGEIGIKDISLGGICLKTSKPLRSRTFHKIKCITFHGVKTSAKSVVVWSAPIKQENRDEGTSLRYEAGLKFIGLSDHEKHSLTSMITNLSG